MNQSVKARYQGGVLLPLDELDLAEGTTVQLTIRPAAWEERIERLLKRVRERAGPLSADEIEGEITRASEEVQAERLGAT